MPEWVGAKRIMLQPQSRSIDTLTLLHILTFFSFRPPHPPLHHSRGRTKFVSDLSRFTSTFHPIWSKSGGGGLSKRLPSLQGWEGFPLFLRSDFCSYLSLGDNMHVLVNSGLFLFACNTRWSNVNLENLGQICWQIICGRAHDGKY